MTLGATACSNQGTTGTDEPSATASSEPTESASSSEGFNAEVTITVADKPTEDREEDLEHWNKNVEAFKQQYPNITLDAKEQVYDATTFQAQLAGGTLPMQLVVPFTEPQGLAARNQIADLTDTLSQIDLLDKLNPELLENATVDGRIYAVPYQAYAVGLVYNRELMEQAGLDPDNPPTTWDELRAQAKTLSDETGATGFAFPNTKNVGGWLFSTICYSFGGRVQNEDGTEVVINQEPCVKALETIKAMRWEDDSMGDTFVYEGDPFEKDFAAGKIGFRPGTPGTYWAATVNNGMDPMKMGVGGMPQDGGVNGTLGGGAVAIVSPDTDDDQKTAATLWIKKYYLDRYLSEEQAVDDAKTRADAELPVGLPDIYPLSEGSEEQYLEWIEPYVNVPVKNYQPYIVSEVNKTIIAEPKSKAQEMYAALDPIVQKVLTDESADPKALLDEAAATLQSKLAR